MFGFKKKRIYLDYAAATPVSAEAFRAYEHATQYFANPQSLHTEALEAKNLYDTAKKDIARVLGVKAQEVVVVSGGTEGNNFALAGFLLGLEEKGTQMSECEVVVSAIEHPSVNEVFEPFVARGLTVVFVEPDEHGVVKPEAIADVLTNKTVLVSVALVNSEIGTVQPLHAISKVVKGYREDILVHTDACQGMYQSLVVHGLGVDLLVLDSGKVYGPRGVGIVYVRQGTFLSPILRGGSQERSLRPGTENTALLCGFAHAVKEAQNRKDTEHNRLEEVRATFIEAVKKEIPGVQINGTGKKQSPHILNISVPGIDAEYVAMRLDKEGYALSTRSACLEKEDAQKSFVVEALGGEEWRARNTLRFSFGRDTFKKDIIKTVEALHSSILVYGKGKALRE